MSILEIIKKRRSIRDFQEKTIPQEVIEKLIEALIWAPSAGNLQSRKFYFVFNQEIKEGLAKASLNQMFIARSPLVIVGCLNKNIKNYYGKRGEDLYAICDVSASVENMLLVATEMSLGGCWVGAFDEKEVSKILNLPENLRPIVICPIGFPAKTLSPPSRLPKSKAIEFIE